MLTSITHGRTGVAVLRLAGVSDVRSRYVHRAREQFGPHAHSVNSALMFVRDHLVAWSMRDKIAVASTVTTVFAENALSYTRGGFDIRLEGTTERSSSRYPTPAQTWRSGVNARRRLPGRLGHRFRAVPSLGERADVDGQNSLGTHRRRRHFRRNHRAAAISRSRSVVKDQSQRVTLTGPHHGQAVAHRGGRPPASRLHRPVAGGEQVAVALRQLGCGTT